MMPDRDARRVAYLETVVDALLHTVCILGVAQVVTLIAVGVMAARLGL